MAAPGAMLIHRSGDKMAARAAPNDGSSAFFTEEGINAAFTEKKGAFPHNADADAGIDFGDSVTLFEIVNKNMSLQARSGDIEACETDVDQAVLNQGQAARWYRGAAAVLASTGGLFPGIKQGQYTLGA